MTIKRYGCADRRKTILPLLSPLLLLYTEVEFQVLEMSTFIVDTFNVLRFKMNANVRGR